MLPRSHSEFPISAPFLRKPYARRPLASTSNLIHCSAVPSQFSNRKSGIKLLKLIPQIPPDASLPDHSLPLVGLRVVQGELLVYRVGHAQRSCFLGGALDIPFIHHQPLQKPHGGRATAARTVNERRLA